MESIVVGITGINAVDNPGPGVGVARSLKESEHFQAQLVGLAYDAMEPGIYMDWLFDRAFMLPYPTAGHEAFFARLAYIRSVTGMSVLIPTLDAELPLIIRYQDRLAEMGIRAFVPSLEQFKLRSKDALPAIGEAIGLAVPETRVVTSAQELWQAIEDIGLPVMVKGVFYKAYRAYTRQEAVGYFNQIAAEWGYPVLVQEVVSGDELNVVAVGDGQGNSLGQVGIKKMWVTTLGKIWTGVTIHHEDMLRATEQFIQQYRWKGAFELECIVREDGKLFLIEINPRFPAWVYFATGVGVNLPERMLRSLLGESVDTASTYEAGKLYIRYTYELITDMKPFQQMITQGER